MVKYDNYALNFQERVLDCSKDFYNAFFWKDNMFKPQQEYRLLFKNVEIEKEISYPIGELKECYIIDIDTFFNLHIDLNFSIVSMDV